MYKNRCKYCNDRIPDNVNICSACVRLQDAIMEVPDNAAMTIIKDMAVKQKEKEPFKIGDFVMYTDYSDMVRKAKVTDLLTNGRVEIYDGVEYKYINPNNLYHDHNVTTEGEGEKESVRTIRRWINLAIEDNKLKVSKQFYSSKNEAICRANMIEECTDTFFVAIGVGVGIPGDILWV